MITGERMFDGPNDKIKMNRIKKGEYDHKKIPNPFSEIIRNTVVVDPIKRWNTEIILQELEKFENNGYLIENEIN